MKNIAIVSFYSGISERGVETFALEIGNRLAQKNKVTVFQAGHTPTQKYKIVEINTSARPPKSSKGILGKIYLDLQSLRILVFSIKIIPMLIKGKYDLIIPLNGGYQIAIFRIISKLTGAKLLVSGHAGIGADDAWNLFFRPDIFVALTIAELEWAKKITPEVKLETIPNGVDLSKFNPQVKPKPISLPGPIVICTSALIPYKQVDLTIKAAAKAKLSLLILGEGEMQGTLDSLGKRLLGKKYLRLVVPYMEIASYYRACDVFTLASRTEAFGISYIEAMACNLPVVTTCDSSREEIIGNAGILTNPQNVDQYAKDLTLATKTNYRNLPYNQALKFSWNKITERYQKLINNL